MKEEKLLDRGIFDNTMMEDWARCPRSSYFRHIKGFVPKGIKMPLLYGTVIHKSEDAMWAEEDPKKALEAGIKALHKSWKAEGGPSSDELFDLNEERRTLPNAEKILRNYIQKNWDRISSYEILGIELPFLVPLGESEFFYCGLIDKLVEKNGALYPLDHKTSSSYKEKGGRGFRFDFVATLKPNNQFLGYCYPIESLFGRKPLGYLVDAILVHKLHQDVFEEFEYPVDQEELKSWELQTIEKAKNFTSAYKRYQDGEGIDSTFPQNTFNCVTKFGNCPYRNICIYECDPEEVPPGYSYEPWEPVSLKVIRERGEKK